MINCYGGSHSINLEDETQVLGYLNSLQTKLISIDLVTEEDKAQLKRFTEVSQSHQD